MNNKKYYTTQTLAEDCAPYMSARGEKTLFKLRAIWKIASNDWKLKRVSFKRYEQAKRLYNAVRREWSLKDKELYFDQWEATQKTANKYANKDIEQIAKIKAQAEALGLVCSCSTWAHIYTKNGSEIL
jgi:cobalamin-dependent methionine synthase I